MLLEGKFQDGDHIVVTPSASGGLDFTKAEAVRAAT